MFSIAAVRAHVHPSLDGYHRVLLPVVENAESKHAATVACRLAAERNAAVTVLTVVEMPPLLPLDARMDEEETAARDVLARVEAIADAYGVRSTVLRVRARDAASAILDQLETGRFELVVLGAARRERWSRQAPVFGRTVQNVLRHAPCRALVVAAPKGA